MQHRWNEVAHDLEETFDVGVGGKLLLVEHVGLCFHLVSLFSQNLFEGSHLDGEDRLQMGYNRTEFSGYDGCVSGSGSRGRGGLHRLVFIRLSGGADGSR